MQTLPRCIYSSIMRACFPNTVCISNLYSNQNINLKLVINIVSNQFYTWFKVYKRIEFITVSYVFILNDKHGLYNFNPKPS